MDYFTVLNPFFHAEKVKCAEISRKTGINARTVHRYYAKFKAMILLPQKVQIGRPKKFPNALNSKIGLLIRKDPRATSSEIAAKLNETLESTLNLKISARTVRRRCNEMGYTFNYLYEDESESVSEESVDVKKPKSKSEKEEINGNCCLHVHIAH